MSKGTILDRLVGAMETLGKREGKALTPKQRVAAAQRWNSLADIGEDRLDKYRNTFGKDFLARDRRHAVKNGLDNADYGDELLGFMDLGLIDETDPQNIARNPFLSKIPAKYDEQTEFLAWCRDNHIPPTPLNLKRFRWEEYQTLPYREQQWIANKDAIRQGVQDEGFVAPYTFTDDMRTLRDLDDAALDYTGSKYDFMKLPVYKSYEEFPDDFDYMWRY